MAGEGLIRRFIRWIAKAPGAAKTAFKTASTAAGEVVGKIATSVSGVKVLKWGSITAAVGGVYVGIKSGISNAFDAASKTVKEVLGAAGINVTDGQSNMIVVAIVVVAVVLLVRFFVRRKG